MNPFQHPVRVYIEDTDAGGIVYYVNYLKFMERARTEFMRSLGYDKPAIFDHELMFVVHSLDASYRKPALLDDQLQVSVKLTGCGRTWFAMEQAVTREGELLCLGNVKVACVDQAKHKPRAIPVEMQQKLDNYLN